MSNVVNLAEYRKKKNRERLLSGKPRSKKDKIDAALRTHGSFSGEIQKDKKKKIEKPEEFDDDEF